MWILFKPEVHKIINSLSFSNFKIVKIKDDKKAKGISLVNILGIVSIEYQMYVLKAWPSSVTRSRKFTAWIVQITATKAKSTITK